MILILNLILNALRCGNLLEKIRPTTSKPLTILLSWLTSSQRRVNMSRITFGALRFDSTMVFVPNTSSSKMASPQPNSMALFALSGITRSARRPIFLRFRSSRQRSLFLRYADDRCRLYRIILVAACL